MRKIVLAVILITGFLFSQNSIYSSYGFGMGSPSVPVRNIGMGFSGSAARDSIGLNTLGPALWHGFLTTSMQGQLNTQFVNAAERDYTGSMTRFMGFAFKMPIGKKLGFAMGMRPVTRMSSEQIYTGDAPYADTVYTYQSTKKTVGGISELYTGFGYKLSPNLSLGLVGRFFYGNIATTHDVDLMQDDDIDISQQRRYNLRGVQTGLGLAWTDRPQKTTIAAYWDQNINFQYDFLLDYQYGPDSTQENRSLDYPSTFSLGCARLLPHDLLVVADFRYYTAPGSMFQEFYLNEPVDAQNAYVIGIGIEKSPSPRKDRKALQKLSYRAGLYQKTEIFSQSDPLKETGVSVGLGIPFYGGLNRLDIALIAARRDGFSSQFGNENLISLHVGVTTGELWFKQFKRR